METKTLNNVQENKIRQEITSELEELENKINSMLFDFKKKYRNADYVIKLKEELPYVAKCNIKLTPSFIV